MFSTEAYALEPLEEIDEQDLFLSILYHDARGGNAIRMLLGENEGEKPYVRHFANRDYRKIGYRSTRYNAYASVNTFKSYKRVSDDVYNLSGIFIDLDGHDFKTVEAMDAAIRRTKKRLQKAFKTGEISPPTMITDTGRGLGIFYILKSSIAVTEKTQKSVRYLDHVRAALTAKYKKMLSGDGYLDVDTTVKDYARVCRMPLTMNKKINRWCRLIHVSYSEEDEVMYYDLKELASNNHLFDEVNKVKKEIAAKKVVSLEAFRLPFLTIRLQKLEILQEVRRFDCSGHREYMIFVYYNAAKQIYGEREAVIATKAFNSRFKEPLADEELEHAFTVTDKNVPPTGDYEGFYKLPDAWIVEMLEVTDEENDMCRFGASKRQIERQHIKKENQQKREGRNKQIADFIIANPKKTYPEIAAQFGVSESTVYRVCKEYDIKRNKVVSQTNPVEAEGSIRRAEERKTKTLQKMSQSLLGVLSVPTAADGLSAQDSLPGVVIEAEKTRQTQDGLVQAYRDLYGQVTKCRKRRKQVLGQMAFRWDSDGNIEYYIVS